MSNSPVVHEEVLSSVGHVEITWFETVPDELRAAFRPYALWMATYAPRWMEKLGIEFNAAASNDSSVSVHIARDYNRANVILKPIWLTQEADKRDDDAAHELVHLYSAQVNHLFDAMTEQEWKDKPDWRALRQSQYTSADETFTVSMARLLLTFMPRPRDHK